MPAVPGPRPDVEPTPVTRLSGRALLLDLDGTLLDSTAVIAASWEKVADAIGVDRAVVAPLVHGIPPRQVVEEVAPWLTADARDRAVDLFFSGVIVDEHPVVWTAGAAELVASLGDDGWAVVTSGSAALAASSMHKAGMRRPPVMVTADDVVVGKPDPAPYLQAAALLGVPPEACVVVEDAPAGVQAGRAAGMQVVAVTGTYPADVLAHATVVVDRLPTVRLVAPGLVEVSVEPAAPPTP